MRPRESEKAVPSLSGADRGAIERFLFYIEDRLKDVEPVCARLVRMARLALQDSDDLKDDPSRVTH